MRTGNQTRDGGAKPTVHALLVGIDGYPAALGRRPLHGCCNDIAAARAWLKQRLDAPLSLKVLLDGEATAEAVTEGITGHLGQAGPEDTALFWFAGHGTDFDAEDPAHQTIEATGRNQALVCFDGPLLDKELGALLGGLAARGVHTAAVLDCCYSGGATRDGELTARHTPPDPGWLRVPRGAGAVVGGTASGADPGVASDTFSGTYPGTSSGTAPGTSSGAQPPVLLAASRLNQLSYENDHFGRTHGLFSRALLDVLAGVGPDATYREILAATHCRVQISTRLQHPVLAPPDAAGPADRPFLGGAVRPPSPHLMRHGRDGWEVDCGSAHGLRADNSLDGTTEFTVTGDTPEAGDKAVGEPGDARVVRAHEVRVDRTLVTSAGWSPDRRRTYPVALSALALPPALVGIDTPQGAPAVGWLRDAIGSAGPGGGPTPLLRVDEGGGRVRFRVVVRDGRAAVRGRDGTDAVPELPLTGPQDAWRIADCLIHLARWHQLHGLSNPASPLGSLVRVEVAPWGRPSTAPGQEADGGGELGFAYGGGPRKWQPPRVSVRIHNRSATRTLWCVLLNLTDSYASHSALYPGYFIGPGRTGFALDNEPVELTLPQHRLLRPGAAARDWLKLIVTEGELNTLPFQLDPWQGDAQDSRQSARSADGILRFIPPAHATRTMGPAAATGPGQWAALTLSLRTVVPEPEPYRRIG